jgi:hypothetical protein
MRRPKPVKISYVLDIRVAALILFALVFVSAVRAGQTGAGAGRTVWDGVFTADQANRGRISYAMSCAECHGARLQGGESKPLNGDVFWNDWRESTVGELLTYISKNMPYSEDGTLAGTLSPSTYVDIVAHVLERNGLPPGERELTPDSSIGVLIVRKDGPGELPANTLARVVGCLAPRAADGIWRLVKATRPERVSSSLSSGESNLPLGEREYQLKFVLTPLNKFVGHRLSVTGLLQGDGGVDGLNVSDVRSVAGTCPS